jgi:voltage-gated potassium channel
MAAKSAPAGALRTTLRRLRIPFVGVFVVFTYAVIGYVLFGYPPIDAMYMASLALTTAGFTQVGEFTDGLKAFTITIAAGGATLFLVLLAVVTSTITEGQIAVRTRRRRMERKVNGLNDHFIVCAYGRVGRAAAREFEAEGKPFVVIDRKEELEDSMRSDGVRYMIGDPASEPILRSAGLERARGIVCAVDDDSSNVFITIVARSINPKIFIVARASDPGTPEVLYRAGADRVISPYVQSGGHMGRLALRPRVRDYLEVAAPDQSKLRLDEILIEPDSSMIGRMLEEVCGEAIPLLMKRSNGEVLPNPPLSTTIAAGDLLLVFGEASQLQAVEGNS